MLRFPSPSVLSRPFLIAIVVSVLGGAPLGCKRALPEQPAPSPSLAGLTVLKDGRWLFTYVNPEGQFETTDKPDIIPETVRKVVRVVDPGNTDHTALAQVYVVDVNQLLKSGQAAAAPFGREAFETAALAQLPPGANSPLSSRPSAPPPGPPPAAPSLAAGMGGALGKAGGHPVVTIYGTSWCGACRAARSYFQQRGIPFADKDIESDSEAARELAEKAAKVGLPTDRVPVLDVRGRLLLGFDQARVEALLGQPT